MESSLKINKQRGYLLILAVVIIIIVGFVGLMLVRMFLGGANSEANVANSNQALYIANSGMEMAKRDILANKVGCSVIGGMAKYTAANFATGQFTVTGTQSDVSSTIAANINNTDPNPAIVLASSSGFSQEGVVEVDSEYFHYTSISGNTLQNVTRGLSGSMVMPHSVGVEARQIQCVLTSAGAVPSTASPNAKRTVRQVIPALTDSFPVEGFRAVFVSTGNVQLGGNSFLANPNVCFTSSAFPGSTVLTSGTASLTGSAGNLGTKVCGCCTAACFANCMAGSGLVLSSTVGQIRGDIIQNYPITGSMFSNFFTQTKAQVQAYVQTPSSKTLYFASGLNNLNSLNGVGGKIIWVNGNVQGTGNVTRTIGSPTNPVILIVNGNMLLGGTSTTNIYGLVYTTGYFQAGGNTTVNGQGMFVGENYIQFNGTGTIILDPSILSKLPIVFPYVVINYTGNAASSSEVFQ